MTLLRAAKERYALAGLLLWSIASHVAWAQGPDVDRSSMPEVSAPGEMSALDELAMSLVELPGLEAIAARVQISVGSREGDDEPRSDRLTLRVEDDGDGLRVIYPETALGSDPWVAAAVEVRALDQVDPARLTRALDFARTIEAMLARASSVTRHDEADSVVLELAIEADPTNRPFYADDVVVNATLRIASDGLPTSVRVRTDTKAGFLFLKASNRITEDFELGRVGDRLVVLREEHTLEISMFGRELETVTTTTISPLPR